MDDVIWPAFDKTNHSNFGPDCSCQTGSQICPVGAGKPDPPSSMVRKCIKLSEIEYFIFSNLFLNNNVSNMFCT